VSISHIAISRVLRIVPADTHPGLMLFNGQQIVLEDRAINFPVEA